MEIGGARRAATQLVTVDCTVSQGPCSNAKFLPWHEPQLLQRSHSVHHVLPVPAQGHAKAHVCRGRHGICGAKLMLRASRQTVHVFTGRWARRDVKKGEDYHYTCQRFDGGKFQSTLTSRLNFDNMLRGDACNSEKDAEVSAAKAFPDIIDAAAELPRPQWKQRHYAKDTLHPSTSLEAQRGCASGRRLVQQLRKPGCVKELLTAELDAGGSVRVAPCRYMCR